MSGTEDIFLSTSLAADEAAERIAGALGFDVERDEHGTYLVREDDDGARLVGELDANYLRESDPEIPNAIDRYSLMWSLHRKAAPDWRRQMQLARHVFNEVVDKLRWPALLTTQDAQMAIADWDPGRGVREFPEGTTVDDEAVVART
jgi:hypothetical protein